MRPNRWWSLSKTDLHGPLMVLWHWRSARYKPKLNSAFLARGALSKPLTSATSETSRPSAHRLTLWWVLLCAATMFPKHVVIMPSHKPQTVGAYFARGRVPRWSNMLSLSNALCAYWNSDQQNRLDLRKIPIHSHALPLRRHLPRMSFITQRSWRSRYWFS